MTQFVPLDAPAKITRLQLRNTGTTTRNLSVTAYAEWVLGTSRGATAPYIITRTDPATGAILAQNTFSTAFPGRVAFADFGAGDNQPDGRPGRVHRAGRFACRTCRPSTRDRCRARPVPPLTPAPPCSAA